ncbi:uncharacterized protein [Cicer arietinum]|uniref:Uncharacterized protein LOC101494758 n=1 Tax=Cicer arietinum TaxID=3827 RepID=A0A1S2XSN5_CICAR|nr:uncharacterized protein LOC101494758 [Cicer arietinum]
MEIKRYLSRRGYRRLDGSISTVRRKKMQVIQMKGSPHKHWRIGTSPRLRWMMKSPLKLLTKVKNIYMNFMFKVAGNVGGALNTDNNNLGVKQIPQARQKSKGYYSGDAFEARLIFEISKTLVASHELYSI